MLYFESCAVFDLERLCITHGWIRPYSSVQPTPHIVGACIVGNFEHVVAGVRPRQRLHRAEAFVPKEDIDRPLQPPLDSHWRKCPTLHPWIFSQDMSSGMHA